MKRASRSGRPPRSRALVISCSALEIAEIEHAVGDVQRRLPTGAHITVHSFAKAATLKEARRSRVGEVLTPDLVPARRRR